MRSSVASDAQVQLGHDDQGQAGHDDPRSCPEARHRVTTRGRGGHSPPRPLRYDSSTADQMGGLGTDKSARGHRPLGILIFAVAVVAMMALPALTPGRPGLARTTSTAASRRPAIRATSTGTLRCRRRTDACPRLSHGLPGDAAQAAVLDVPLARPGHERGAHGCRLRLHLPPARRLDQHARRPPGPARDLHRVPSRHRFAHRPRPQRSSLRARSYAGGIRAGRGGIRHDRDAVRDQPPRRRGRQLQRRLGGVLDRLPSRSPPSSRRRRHRGLCRSSPGGGEASSLQDFIVSVTPALTLRVTPAVSSPTRRVTIRGSLSPLSLSGATVTVSVQLLQRRRSGRRSGDPANDRTLRRLLLGRLRPRARAPIAPGRRSCRRRERGGADRLAHLQGQVAPAGSGCCRRSARLPPGQAEQAVLQRRVLRNLDGRAEDAHRPPCLRLGAISSQSPRTRSGGSVPSTPMNFAMS